MFTAIPAVEAQVDQLIAQGRHNEALAHISVGVHQHYKSPEVAHHALYYPQLDRQMEQIAQALAAAHPPATVSPTRNNLVIATELYQVGGHSRVVEDFMRELESPTLVLTDMFGNYRKEPRHLDWVQDAYPDASVIALQPQTMWGKCRALLSLTQRLAPRNIFYFHHHQDPIALVGTLPHGGARKTLVHHADHNPSLGCTLPGFAHADFTDELAAVCARELGVAPTVLPLYVADSGLKPFSPAADDNWSVITSGSQVKFARSGELALQNIVQTVLAATKGRFIHIGPMDAEWGAEIRAHLGANGIDPNRFLSTGPVASLWQALGSLDAHIYLGSAPVAGGRAAIEAQGCGYPLAFFRVADESSLVAADSIYANKELGWRTLPELATLLGAMGKNLPQLSAQARGFYQQHYSREQFLRVLAGLSGD